MTQTLRHVPEEYHEYATVFSPIEVENVPPHRPYDASIDLDEGKTPPFGPMYHLSQHERAVLFDYVKTNLRKGFIRRSTSTAASPAQFVLKKTGELRLCVDYRGLNSITKKNRYPLPLVDDLLDRVQGCKVFSVIDLKNAFNLIRIKDGDEWKTASRTHLGLFEYTVMPFDLTYAPGIFQAFIQDTLRDLLDVVCVVYIDDILIFSRNQEEHYRHVTLVLERLRNAGLFANGKQCAFERTEVEYLGYLLSADGIKMHPRKLETIADWPRPQSIKDVQSFLGFTNFHKCFIDNYAKTVLPLNALTKKDRRGILHQPDAQGFLHPVAYYSRKLTPAEINYEVYDKELLAVVESFRDMRAWCIGTTEPIAVVSDHKNLEYFMSSRILNRRQARWLMLLSEFNFQLDYAPGHKHPADAPSRRPDFAPREGDDVLHLQNKVLLTSSHTERLFPTTSTVPDLTPEPQHIATTSTLSLDNSELLDRYTSAIRDDSEWREAIAHENSDFKLDGNLVFHKAKLFIPSSMCANILFTRHDSVIAGHPGRTRTLAFVQHDYSWPGMNTYVRNYVRACNVCA